MPILSLLLPVALSAGAVDATQCAPSPNGPGPWVSVRDYPPQARRKGLQGNVGFTLDVSASGCPTKCVVTASSGHKVLDDETCRLMLERARFEPKLDENGAPVAATWSHVMRWRL
jgi:TonB family protein